MIEKIHCYECFTDNENPEGKSKLICKECGAEIEPVELEKVKKAPIYDDDDLELMKSIQAVQSGTSRGSGCFIATAAMGNYDHPQVNELRHFRDQWILLRPWGQGFVNWYYKYGSKAAKVIEKSFVLKKMSYGLIVYPLVHLSRRLLK